VISRVDYCNSVLLGLRASTVSTLQRVKNGPTENAKMEEQI